MKTIMKEHSVNCHMYYCKNRTKDHIYMDFHTCNCQPSEEKDQYGHKIIRPTIPDNAFDELEYDRIAKELKETTATPKQEEWEEKIYDLLSTTEPLGKGFKIIKTDAGTANEIIDLIRQLLKEERAKMAIQDNWSEEFDERFVTFYGEVDEYGNTTEGETIIDVDPKEVKSFISQLLKKEREKVIEEVKKNTKDLTKYETEFTCPCGIEHSVQFLIRKPKVMKGKITEITINGEQLKK